MRRSHAESLAKVEKLRGDLVRKEEALSRLEQEVGHRNNGARIHLSRTGSVQISLDKTAPPPVPTRRHTALPARITQDASQVIPLGTTETISESISGKKESSLSPVPKRRHTAPPASISQVISRGTTETISESVSANMERSPPPVPKRRYTALPASIAQSIPKKKATYSPGHSEFFDVVNRLKSQRIAKLESRLKET